MNILILPDSSWNRILDNIMKGIHFLEFDAQLRANPLDPRPQEEAYTRTIPFEEQENLNPSLHSDLQQNLFKGKQLFECIQDEEEIEISQYSMGGSGNQGGMGQSNVDRSIKGVGEKKQEVRKNIFDFIENQEDEEEELERGQERGKEGSIFERKEGHLSPDPEIYQKPKSQLITPPKLEQKTKESPQDSKPNDSPPSNPNTTQPKDSNQKKTRINLFPPETRYFPLSQIILLRSIIPPNSLVNFAVTFIRHSEMNTIYSLRLYDEQICRCVCSNSKFVFECSDGPISQMSRVNRNYQIQTLNGSYKQFQTLSGIIRMKNKQIHSRSFISMSVKLDLLCANSVTDIREYNTRDPIINKSGKFQLSVGESKKSFRASLNNFILLDAQERQVCRLLRSSERELAVFEGFSPLISFMVSVAKLDWTREKDEQ